MKLTIKNPYSEIHYFSAKLDTLKDGTLDITVKANNAEDIPAHFNAAVFLKQNFVVHDICEIDKDTYANLYNSHPACERYDYDLIDTKANLFDNIVTDINNRLEQNEKENQTLKTIKPVFEKFDGKIVNKRLKTALENADKSLCVTINKGGIKPQIVYDIDIQQYTGHDYNTKYLINLRSDVLDENDRLKASIALDKIEKRIEQNNLENTDLLSIGTDLEKIIDKMETINKIIAQFLGNLHSYDTTFGSSAHYVVEDRAKEVYTHVFRNRY